MRHEFLAEHAPPFGLDEPRPDAGTLPLLLVLPGADGSGITAWMQFPSLAQEYAVRALCVPAGDRSSHADLVALVSQEVRSVGEGRELFLLGESMGSGVAIDVALDVPQEGAAAFTLRDVFDVPDLATTNDDIVNGTWQPVPDGTRPLAPFTANVFGAPCSSVNAASGTMQNVANAEPVARWQSRQ